MHKSIFVHCKAHPALPKGFKKFCTFLIFSDFIPVSDGNDDTLILGSDRY